VRKTKDFFSLLFFICILASICLAGDTGSPVAVAMNISYVKDGSALQKLDVYFQPKATGLPVLVFIHGGAWISGDKIITKNQAVRMTGHGFVFVSVNYRLSPFVIHPRHVLDCALAVQWVKKNIHDFGGDSGAMFLAGYSAGGHLCSLLACDPRYLDSVEMKPRQIRGYLVMGPGGMDLDRLAQNRSSQSLQEEFFKMIFGERSEWKDACPITHVCGSEPPMFVAVAEFDRLIRRKDCERFVSKSCLLGGNIRFYIIPGKKHLNAFQPFGNEDDPLTQEILFFIEENR